MEEWRDVPGYEGKYQISIATKEGRCRSLNYRCTGKTKELSSKPNTKQGRIGWVLCKIVNGVLVHKSKQAAVWIALTFPELVQNEWFEGAEIDHIDTDRLNNHPSNLRWVDKHGQQNNKLTKEHQMNSAAKQRGKMVAKYSLTGEVLEVYESICAAARSVGGNDSRICKCCKGDKYYRTAYGYIWKYA